MSISDVSLLYIRKRNPPRCLPPYHLATATRTFSVEDLRSTSRITFPAPLSPPSPLMSLILPSFVSLQAQLTWLALRIRQWRTSSSRAFAGSCPGSSRTPPTANLQAPALVSGPFTRRSEPLFPPDKAPHPFPPAPQQGLKYLFSRLSLFFEYFLPETS